MAEPTLTLAQALRDAQAQGLPRLDAQLLLGHVLGGRTRSWLLAHDDDLLSPAQQEAWQQLVRQRQDEVPLAYLTGQHEFFGLSLEVTPDVLDPRPDTETLVEWALACLTERQTPDAVTTERLQIADLGTGSGAIALAVAQAHPTANVSAVDLSPAALAVAQRNGQRLGIPVQWHQGRWFDPLAGRQFDVLVSNPPYLADDDPHLPALRHEPRQALCAGADGLDDLRHLITHAPAHLLPGGWLLLEHGWQQADAVAGLLQARGFVDIQHRHDLAGHRRCTGGRWPADFA